MARDNAAAAAPVVTVTTVEEVATPFKAKAELYGLVVPDRPMTPLPPPPQIEEDDDDDDDENGGGDDDDDGRYGKDGENGDEKNGNGDNENEVGTPTTTTTQEEISKEERIALEIAKDGIMNSPRPETESERKQRRGTWRKSWGKKDQVSKK